MPGNWGVHTMRLIGNSALISAALIGLGLTIAPVAAFAQTVAQPTPVPATTATQAPARPVTDESVSAVDVIATPASDLNIKKTDIPALLIAAQDDPYTLGGLRSCSALGAEIGRFDAVLGEDLDVREDAAARLSAGRVAQSVVGAMIPFRGVIRELSGANDQDRKMRAAIFAGGVRRGFLKGVGIQRGCPYPARPATAAIAAQAETARTTATAARRPASTRRSGKKVRYTAQPVVQTTR